MEGFGFLHLLAEHIIMTHINTLIITHHHSHHHYHDLIFIYLVRELFVALAYYRQLMTFICLRSARPVRADTELASNGEAAFGDSRILDNVLQHSDSVSSVAAVQNNICLSGGKDKVGIVIH